MRRRLLDLALPPANPNRRRSAGHVQELVRAVVSLRGNRVEGIVQSARRTRAIKVHRGPLGAETLCPSRSSRQSRQGRRSTRWKERWVRVLVQEELISRMIRLTHTPERTRIGRSTSTFPTGRRPRARRPSLLMHGEVNVAD